MHLTKLTIIVALALCSVSAAQAQELQCSDDEQATLDACIEQGIADCRSAVPASCDRHAATVTGAVERFQSRCCMTRSGRARSARGFRTCKEIFLTATRPVARLFGAEFARSVREEIRNSELEDCE